MSIEIHEPELEAMIRNRMVVGRFQSVEEMLRQALEAAPLPAEQKRERARRTGADLVAVMQAMPYKDIDIEPSRPHLQVRDVTL